MPPTAPHGNAQSLLQHDPAEVVLAILDNEDALDRLEAFASKLTRYVELAKRNSNIGVRGNTSSERRTNASHIDRGPKRRRVEQRRTLSYSATDTAPTASSHETKSPNDLGSTEENQIELNMASQTVGPPPKDYDGSLHQSQLQRSVGLTRHQLNQHLTQLGLTSTFFDGFVVSKKSGSNNEVAHLTFDSSQQRNNAKLPHSTHQNLQWTESDGRQLRWTRSANLFPNVNQPAVPIFWAQPGWAGALCHYVGHFQCCRFKGTKYHPSKPNRAFLEFRFVGFQQELADAMAKIAAEM